MTEQKLSHTPALSWLRAMSTSSLPATTKLVLYALDSFVGRQAEAPFPSVRKLVERTSLSEKAVRHHLKKAESLGWLTRAPRFHDSGRQTSNWYLLQTPGGMSGVGAILDVPPPDVPPSPGNGVRRTGGEPGSQGTTLKSPHEQTTLTGMSGAPAPDTFGRAAQFDHLWEAKHPSTGKAPRRGSKKQARDQYMRKVPKVVEPDTVFAAWTTLLSRTPELEFVPHLFRWLRDERWEEHVPERGAGVEPEPGSAEWLTREEARIGG